MSDLLNADHLAEAEEREEQALPEQFTLAEAIDRLRRIRYWQRKMKEIDETAGAEIERIKAWAEGEKERPLRSIGFHEAWLAAYYRAHPPSKGKTLKLPGGAVKERDQQPEWVYGDEAGIIDLLKANGKTGFIRSKEVLDKALLKKHADVADGGVRLVSGDGEVLELPIKVVERESKVEVKLEEE